MVGVVIFLVCLVMDRSSPLDVTIIDKDESSEQSYNVVDGFIIEDSKSPFRVSNLIHTHVHTYIPCPL